MERNYNSSAAPNRRAPSGCAQDTAKSAPSATAPAARPLRRRPAPFRRKEVAMPRGQRLLNVTMWGATSMLGCGETTEDGVVEGRSSALSIGAALPGTSATTFAAARANFAATENASAGQGPIYTEQSCGGCHSNGALGGAGQQIERRYGPLTSGVFDPMAS